MAASHLGGLEQIIFPANAKLCPYLQVRNRKCRGPAELSREKKSLKHKWLAPTLGLEACPAGDRDVDKMLVRNGHLPFFYATIEEASMRRLLVTTIGAEDGNFVAREI